MLLSSQLHLEKGDQEAPVIRGRAVRMQGWGVCSQTKVKSRTCDCAGTSRPAQTQTGLKVRRDNSHMTAVPAHPDDGRKL